MPGTKEIVVISGMAPIFADKVRAWEEPMFLTRTGEPPIPPKVKVVGASAQAVDVSSLLVTESVRSIEPADVGALRSMELEDFSTDFSSIEVPQGELSAAEIERLASVFMTMATGDDDTRAQGRDMGA